MPMLSDPSYKYEAPPPVPLENRQWPSRRTTSAPIWLSTDLRDGNQALVNPMSNKTKLKLFRLLCDIGFKQIEVAYPSSSEQEFQFVRSLIDNDEIPDGVAIQIITPCREDLIRRSIDSLAGSKHAIIHLYNAVSPVFREVVFRNSPEKTLDLVVKSVQLVKQLTEECTAKTGTHFQLNYCMETFSQTEPEFTVRLGNAVMQAWGKAGPGDNKVMFNMAATVEIAQPNHYADMVEYFCTHIQQREFVIPSIHPHNDRGTGVAAAELALLAGGERIEGCLLGNGERTGNVDLITLALNLYSHGISPNLDFSNLKYITQVVSECNEMSVPPRYPYAGELVFTAFAGTHQDAIKKGFDAQKRRWDEADRKGGKKLWKMPYIPIDPKDLGYGYENLIRVSSQSGKAGAAYILKMNMNLDLPRRMQVAFYNIVQAEAEAAGKEMTTQLIQACFKRTYFIGSKTNVGRIQLLRYDLFSITPNAAEPNAIDEYPEDLLSVSSNETDEPSIRLDAVVMVDGEERRITGTGSGPLSALVNALRLYLGIELAIHESTSHVAGEATESSVPHVATYLEVSRPGKVPSSSGSGTIWGVGLSTNKTTSRLRSLVSATNSFMGDQADLRARTPFRLSASRMPSVRRSDSQTRIPQSGLRTGSVPPTGDRWKKVDGGKQEEIST